MDLEWFQDGFGPHGEWHGWDADDLQCVVHWIGPAGWQARHPDFHQGNPHTPLWEVRGQVYDTACEAMAAADAAWGKRFNSKGVA